MNYFRFSKPIILVYTLLCVTQSLMADQAELAIKTGQKIAFLGDSITMAGARSGGYCQFVLFALKQQGIEVEPVFAGISGHKSNQMLARLDKDVLNHKPNVMTLSCGVNDVWHGERGRGVSLEDYKKNITSIVDKAQKAGASVILLTATMIKEDQSNDLNQKLKPYNEFLRSLAKEKKCLLADLNKEMQEALKKFPESDAKGKQLTNDGVHMNVLGNIMMGRGLGKTLGLTDEQLDEVEKKWKALPKPEPKKKKKKKKGKKKE